MKKISLILAVAALALSTQQASAQDQPVQTQTARSAENIQKEASDLKARIEQYVIKVEANRDNEKVDYEAEQVRIAEMKAKWESLTGKTWKEKEDEK
jgi:hypothetical protein